jgi:hypothetical protein
VIPAEPGDTFHSVLPAGPDRLSGILTSVGSTSECLLKETAMRS